MKHTTIEDWGIIAYADAWKRQTEWFDALVEAKRNQQPYTNKIVMCQHPCGLHTGTQRQGSQYADE